MLDSTLNRLTSNPFGRAFFNAVRPAVHFVRHMVYPNVPTNHAISKVTYRDRQFSLQYRRWDPEDLGAIQQCFIDGQYDLPDGAHGVFIERVYQEIVASGRKPLILDCGANIGASVLWFAARYPQAHIIAVEPALDNFELLQMNCRNLDVDLRHAGIAATDGRAILSNPTGGHMSYRMGANGDGPEMDLVSVGTLLSSKPSSLYVPFLMKVDIEGGEKALFNGDVSAINSFTLIIMEPHDWMLPGELSSREFFRFHVASGREFCMKHENVASIAVDDGRTAVSQKAI